MLVCLFVLNLEYICIFKFETGSIQMYVSFYFCACTMNMLSVFLSQLLSDSVKLCVRALRIEDSFKKLCACTGYHANHSTSVFRLRVGF